MFVFFKKVFPFIHYAHNPFTLFYTLEISRKKLLIIDLKSFSI